MKCHSVPICLYSIGRSVDFGNRKLFNQIRMYIEVSIWHPKCQHVVTVNVTNNQRFTAKSHGIKFMYMGKSISNRFAATVGLADLDEIFITEVSFHEKRKKTKNFGSIFAVVSKIQISTFVRKIQKHTFLPWPLTMSRERHDRLQTNVYR